MLFNGPRQVKPAVQEQSGGMEFFGDPILEAGEHSITELPPSLKGVLERIDVNALPVSADAKEFLAKVQQETMAAVDAAAIDTSNVQVQKITNLTQLTAEQRTALTSMLKDVGKVGGTAGAAAGTGDKGFASMEEMYAHIGKRLAGANAAKVAREAEEESEEAATTHKPLFGPRQAAQPVTQPEKPGQPAIAPDGMTHCPHCRLNLYVGAPLITAEQKRDFMSAMLHGQSYFEAAEYFGGALKVKFVALTNLQQDYLAALGSHLSARDDVSSSDRYDFYVRAAMVASVAELIVGDRRLVCQPLQPESDLAKGVETILDRYSELLEYVPDGEIMRMLSAETLKFGVRCRELVAMGVNPDFWRPIR